MQPEKTLTERCLERIARIAEDFKHEKDLEKYSFKSSMIVVGFIALILIANFMGGKTEDSLFININNYLYPAFLFSKALLIIFILSTIQRVKFIKTLLKLNATKFFITLFFSGVVLYANTKASSKLNNIFGMDASVFTYSKTYMTVIYAVDYFNSYLIFLSVLLIIFYICEVWLRYRNEEMDRFLNSSTLFLVVSLMSLAVLLGSQSLDINSDNMKVKAYKLAVTLDFNDTYHCKNISQGNRVVFIGASQEKVLVDYTQDPKKI